MATYDLYSHSPRLSDAALLQHRVAAPVTPVHSPHHSVHSSTSTRTPLHTLSIHEYRKQQSTPLSRVATPSGRILRRKASVFALNEIERAPPTKTALRQDSQPAPRPLQSSYSAHQLVPQDQSFDVKFESGLFCRSQSAEPRAQAGSKLNAGAKDSEGKVRHFGTRKRLPRPPAATGTGFQSPSFAPVRPTRQIRASLPAPLSFLTEESNLSDTISTPTPSLSRFPKPPHFETIRETEREQAISFATVAPATPPATPATIHYRGASFDLVNPHASLPYHNIVTPSKELDSSELLPFRPSLESFSSNWEMAPKRPLYGDLNAAHAGIVRRNEDPYSSSMLDLPLPPTPAAVTPGSSTYTSPIYSPESYFAPSPLAITKAPDESRFSIRQLARTLTKRLTKPLDYGEEEELQQFQESRTNGPPTGTDLAPVRPLQQTYNPAERMYFPISPVSPSSPTSLASLHDLVSISDEDEDEVEYARRVSSHNYDSKGLTLMVPDDRSTQIGRADHPRASLPATGSEARPYYDDLASIYASSSIYTGDDRRRSTYQQSLAGNRQSTALLHYSGMSASGMAEEYSYTGLEKRSRPLSPAAQKIDQRSTAQGDVKTDTISNLIDQYDPKHMTTSVGSQPIMSVSTTSLIEPYASDHQAQPVTAMAPLSHSKSSFSGFQFELGRTGHTGDFNEKMQPKDPATRALKNQPGVPPSAHLPLAPAFQYDQAPKHLSRPDFSGTLSTASHYSYGDTRNLLQLPQSEVGASNTLEQRLQPSSSYSQPDHKGLEASSSYSQLEGRTSPHTPQEALDQAELIFYKAAAESEPNHEDIPAIWGRQSPVNLPRNKRLTNSSLRTVENENFEWETVAGDSQQGRMSLDSIADYSSSASSRNSLGLTAAASISSWTKQNQGRGHSLYSHPSPIRTHVHPFSSSPPYLPARPDSQTAPGVCVTETPSSPPTLSTLPALPFSNQPRRAIDEPFAFAPWADPYALSDKETQELLASGPNDDILFDSGLDTQSKRLSYRFKTHGKLSDCSSPGSFGNEADLERENTFDKFTTVGPKGNLTGTPQGTGMHDAGSSIADTSNPGAKLSSSVGPNGRSDYKGFYASPFPAAGSVTRIRHSSSDTELHHERTPSQVTLFPSSYSVEPVQGSSPLAGPDGCRSLRSSTTFKPARRASRAAVPGQTKLRQMVLAPDARSTVSSKDTRFSRFLSAGGSGRPSTSDTVAPLHPRNPSLDTFPTIRGENNVFKHQHSPHLLCPERKVNEEDELRRRKVSWLIFACFCILPPCMFLFRMWGDSIMVSVTKGDLGHCTAQSKRTALIAGVVVNIGLVTAILVPILVAQALKAI